MQSAPRLLTAALFLTAPAIADGQPAIAQSLEQGVSLSKASPLPATRFKTTVTTIFWVGEGATADSGFIDNYGSVWDADWMKHFGGRDSPARRKGYLPAAFRPKQNPFYIALPFSDVDPNGKPKAIAKKIPGYGVSNEPLTRNRWVEVRYKGKSCFAQWQDAGPNGVDDFDWVFGNATAPKNKQDLKAGLDISPATAQCLGIKDFARTEWRFVTRAEVPDGPWTEIITR